ncbi:MAG: hypothetical protein M1818_003570 [Claussenomyces sp. TS43310]|nr:MAG: hypothetical protein M1818_003570 [Claussenomyces sp. TS43310]
MAMSLPPDPYVALGVGKTASLAEIRSAHRKLVIKCHPDKVQDPTLKAIKQEEFHKVQQAYELLSDDAKRVAYDEQVKLMELRKELGRNGSAAGSSAGTVFDYEVREAAPRPSTFAKSKSKPEPSKVYSQPPPRSYEDDLGSRMYDESMRSRPRKTTSYEEPRRTSVRDEERRRRAEDDKERLREKADKEARKFARGSEKKSRDKERRKGTEEKHSGRTVPLHATDESSDEFYRSSKSDKKSNRRAVDEEVIRQREKEAARAAEKQAALTDRTRKMYGNMGIAAEYMAQAQRRKAAPVEAEEEFRPKPMRRAETFQGTSYGATSRYAAQPTAYATVEEADDDDDDYPRRSSARPSPRRASEQIPSSTRSTRDAPRPSAPSRKNSSAYDAGKPYIVDAGPPTAAATTAAAPTPRKPPMPPHTSAPANLHNMVPPGPARARTMPTSYAVPPAPLGRSQTFQAGDKASKSRSSHLKKTVEYDGEDSESDSPYGPSPSAPPVRRQPEPVRYIISKDRNAIPIASRHRSTARDDDYSRDRSPSPRESTSRRTTDRPPLTRSGGGGKPTSTRNQSYYSTSPPEPISLKVPVVKEARPKMSARESTTSARGHSSVPYFGEVKYAAAYGPNDVTYSPDGYRRGAEPYGHASRRTATYA